MRERGLCMLSEDELRQLRRIEQHLGAQEWAPGTDRERRRPRRERIVHDGVLVTAVGETVLCDVLGAYQAGWVTGLFAIAVLVLRWHRFPPSRRRPREQP